MVASTEREITLTPYGTSVVLGALDSMWMAHLEDMEALQEAVRISKTSESDIRGLNWAQIDAVIRKATGDA